MCVAATVLAGVGLGATPASAKEQPAPPPVVVGTNGQSGYVSIEARSPGSGGGSVSAPADHVGSSDIATGGGGGSTTIGGGGGGGGGAGGGDGGGGPAALVVSPYLNLGVSNAQYNAAPGLYNQCGPYATNPGLVATNAAGLAACLTGPPPAAPANPAGPAGAAALPPPPPPDPAVVAQLAIKRLNLAAGAPRLSANPRTAVGLPVWMWVDGGAAATGPLTATAKAGPTSVTATATLARIEWSMGPGGAKVVCHGPGTPAPVNTPLYAGQDSPTCGYTYTLRSLPERTGGTGRWPVTATSVWRITWAGGGQTGAQDLPLTAGTDVEVGELQAVVTGGS